MAPRKWTRQSVIERIRFYHQQGIPVGQIYRQDKGLSLVSYSLFGSWRAALEAAGFQSVQQSWSRERIIKELKEEHATRSSENGRRQLRDSRLKSAVRRHFGRRHEALYAAGIIENQPRKEETAWTPSLIIEAILARHKQGLPLVNVAKLDTALFKAAVKAFGGWHKAKVAAGLAWKLPSREEIIYFLQSRHQRGESLVRLSQTDERYCRSMRNLFGNLHNALTAAGIPSQLRPRWNKQSVIEAIRIHYMKGPDLSLVWRDDRPLFIAACNHFGNWKSAVKAAGIRLVIYEKWTKKHVLEALQRTYHGQSIDDVDQSIVRAAVRCFGGFYIALEAAGLDLPLGKWSKQRIIRRIQEYYVEGRRLGTSGFGDRLLAESAKRYFGTWREAVKAAGLESRMPLSLPKQSWSAEGVLEAIRSVAESGGKLSQARKDWRLYYFAMKHFSSWHNAVVAAGCKTTQRSWTKDLVIHEIQERHRRDLAQARVIDKQGTALASAAKRYFGNWRAALVAAGIPKEKLPRRKANRHR